MTKTNIAKMTTRETEQRRITHMKIIGSEEMKYEMMSGKINSPMRADTIREEAILEVTAK